MFHSGTTRSCHAGALRNQGQRLLKLALAMLGLGQSLAGQPQGATAQGRLAIGGSEIVITASNGFQQLRFRNQPIAEGETISLLGKLADQGSEALLFVVKPGGGACRGGVLALTARPGEEARFDRRLIDECGGFEIARTEQAILLISAPNPAVSGALWRLTATAGLKLEASLAFTPEPGTTFRDLKPGMNARALLHNQAVWTGFTSLAGPDLKRYAMLLMTGGQPIDAPPPFLTATGCGGDCKSAGALMVIDPAKPALYLASRLKGEKARTRPDLAQWPTEAKTLLTGWSKRFD